MNFFFFVITLQILKYIKSLRLHPAISSQLNILDNIRKLTLTVENFITLCFPGLETSILKSPDITLILYEHENCS